MSEMSKINLKSYFKKHKDNTEWLTVLQKFPEGLQREIIAEWPDGKRDEIEWLASCELEYPYPVKLELKNVLSDNLDNLTLAPQYILDIINKKWNIKAKRYKFLIKILIGS